VDAFYADKNREYSTLTRAEMSHCALALGQIGEGAGEGVAGVGKGTRQSGTG